MTKLTMEFYTLTQRYETPVLRCIQLNIFSWYLQNLASFILIVTNLVNVLQVQYNPLKRNGLKNRHQNHFRFT